MLGRSATCGRALLLEAIVIRIDPEPFRPFNREGREVAATVDNAKRARSQDVSANTNQA
jgi:hypothetical protein